MPTTLSKTLAVLLLAAAAWAQTPAATLVGRVTDITGATVPEAIVRVRNLATNEIRQTATSAEGNFTAPNLSPGKYTLTVEKQGFRRLEQGEFELQVDQTARLELRLEVGAVAETMEVHAEVPLLNTESASKGDVIVTQEIGQMPLDGRDFSDLAFLVPGVAPSAENADGSPFAINGARSDNSNFILDGFTNQQRRSGGPQARPPIDAIQEFKMQTTGYPAEYGRFGGGVMNMALKTGGNELHGVVSEFLRNDVLDARNFFDAGKSKLRRNQFGATASGPVWLPRLYDGRNRTFFLASWESYRQVIGGSRLGRIPSDLERTGDFSETRDVNGKPVFIKDPLASGSCGASSQGACFPGNRIPSSRIDPIARKVLAFYPTPNRPGQANNFLAAGNDRDTWDSYLIKGDHRLNDQDTISARYLVRPSDTQTPWNGKSDLPEFGLGARDRQTLGGISWTRIFTPTLINEFRTGVSRTSHVERTFEPGRDYAAELGIEGVTKDARAVGMPMFQVRNYVWIGHSAALPREYSMTNYQWTDTVTWVRTRHLVKFGGDIVRSQFFQPNYNNVRGTFNFLGRLTNDTLGDLLLGLPNTTTRQVGVNRTYMFTTNAGFFVQDDYKISPRVTLNLGLRYEILKPAVEKYGVWSNFVPELGKLIVADDRMVPDFAGKIAQAGLTDRIGMARDYGLPKSLVYTDYNNLAPRFGVAWRPFGGTRTVLRGGYGIFYGAHSGNRIRNLGDVFPFSVGQSFNRPSNNVMALSLSNPFPENRASLQGTTSVSGYELRPSTEYLQSWNLTVERDIGAASAIELAYVGSKGTHLGRNYDINQPFRQPELRTAAGDFPRPVPAFSSIGFFAFGSNSSYNSATVSLRRRARGGVFYRFSYVFGKSLDNASQLASESRGGYAGAQDARNLRLERGRSDWDSRHSVLVSFSWEPRFRGNRLLDGWQLAGTGRAYTGQPFTVRVSNADLNLGEANRPERIANGRLENPTVERWFDLSAFRAVPAGSYRFGNSGRNILDGPGMLALNASLSRRFRFGERQSLQFRWEAFNATNHANFYLPENFIDAPNGGTITRARDARTMQMALKYQF